MSDEGKHDEGDPGAELLERIVAAHELEPANAERGSDRREVLDPDPNMVTRYWWHTAWITFTIAILIAAFLLAQLG